MAHPLTLPAAAVLSLIGAGIGIQLGHSSIAEINPIYFSTPETGSKFYADYVPNGRNWAAVQASELRTAESGQELFHGCVGCRTYPEEYYPVHEASLGKSRESWAQAVEAAAYEPAPEVMTPEPDPRMAAIQRYSTYPIAADEGVQELAMAEVEADTELPME